jgi:hypothetical protein
MKKLMNKKILHKLNTCTIVIEKEYYFLTANFSQKLNIRFSLKSSLETKAIFRITKLIQKFGIFLFFLRFCFFICHHHHHGNYFFFANYNWQQSLFCAMCVFSGHVTYICAECWHEPVIKKNMKSMVVLFMKRKFKQWLLTTPPISTLEKVELVITNTPAFQILVHSMVLKFKKIWLSGTLNIIRKHRKSLFSKGKRAITYER